MSAHNMLPACARPTAPNGGALSHVHAHCLSRISGPVGLSRRPFRPLSPLTSPAPRRAVTPAVVASGGLEGEAAAAAAAFAGDVDGFRDRGARGYTPFEFIEFTDLPLKHEVSVWVDRPVADCYRLWDNRLNWMQWFDMIDEVGFHEEEPTYISMYLWYRWATTPFLELYVTLERTQAEENKFILEEPVEGLPLVAAVLFQEGGEGVEGDSTGTTVTLRLSYLLPKMLYEFAGETAVYGDVDRKLARCMGKMKEIAEGANIEELEAVRRENEAEIRANFAEQRVKKAGVAAARAEQAKRWEAEAAAAATAASVVAAPAPPGEESGSEGEGSSDEGAAVAAAAASGAPKRRTRTRKTSAPGEGAVNPAAKRRSKKSTAATADG